MTTIENGNSAVTSVFLAAKERREHKEEEGRKTRMKWEAAAWVTLLLLHFCDPCVPLRLFEYSEAIYGCNVRTCRGINR